MDTRMRAEYQKEPLGEVPGFGSPRRSSARRDEGLLIVNGNQSALPFVHHPRIAYRYYYTISRHVGNIPRPENLEHWDQNLMPITQSTRGTEEHGKTIKNFVRYLSSWDALFVVTNLEVWAYLMSFVVRKFEMETETPYETHQGFIEMATASFIMMLFTWMIALFTNSNSKGSVFEVIRKTLFWFFVVNSHLSLLVVLFVPAIYSWTGYVLVLALFVFILWMSLKFGNIRRPENLELSDHNPMPITHSTRGTEDHLRTTQEFTDTRDVPNWSYIIIVSVHLLMCACLEGSFPSKFGKKTQSPFKTHREFIAMSITSSLMMLITLLITAYTEGNSKGSVFTVILETLFWFSFFNSPLSLGLVLLVPTIYNWIGYIIVFAWFLLITAFNFKSLKMSLAVTPEHNMGEIEMV